MEQRNTLALFSNQQYFLVDSILRLIVISKKNFIDDSARGGFKRTVWQLVFPGQIAGLIKRIPPTTTGVNEYHIRFYRDGTIECELEVDRWSLGHWTGPRHYKQEGQELLKELLDNEIPDMSTVREYIIDLVGSKDFTDRCVRPR